MIMRLSIISIVFLFTFPLLTIGQDGQNDTLKNGMNKKDVLLSMLKSFVPSMVVVQNAGNMGVLSCGVGWEHGRKKHWETHFLIGFVPKHKSSTAKITMTLKENYIPWHKNLAKGWDMNPLTCGMYVNVIFGNDFWNHQPSRYPNNYYWFSTKIRTNIFVGQRVNKDMDSGGHAWVKSVAFFYEVSSCDLYVIDYVNNKKVGLKDILGLSIGLKLIIF